MNTDEQPALACEEGGESPCWLHLLDDLELARAPEPERQDSAPTR